jgi:hypothetical protein
LRYYLPEPATPVRLVDIRAGANGDGRIRVEFEHPVAFLLLTPEDALLLARSLDTLASETAGSIPPHPTSKRSYLERHHGA